MRRLVPAALLALAAPAAAEPSGKPTPLYEDDLRSGKTTRLDGDDDLGDIEAAIGGGGFSTKELEKIETRLRTELRRDRPRATPRLVVFIYPGRVSAEALRGLREILVDMDLVIDPCDRAVCEEAFARHIELVGRAVGRATIASQAWKMSFRTLTLKAESTMKGAEVAAIRVPIADCVAASSKPGGGSDYIASRKRAVEDYEPIVIKAIARQAQSRRLVLAEPPRVSKSGGAVDVTMRVKGDRARTETQVTDALAAAMSGLRENPATPPQVQLEVLLDVAMKGEQQRRFRCPGQPVGLVLDGKLVGDVLWASYISEVKKQPGAQQMTFDDAEASGRAPVEEAGEPDDNQVIALLGENFPAIGACAKEEIARNPKFGGVTIAFKWQPDGRAAEVKLKEQALRGGPLARCIEGAITKIKFPRFSGGARDIEYPVRLK